MKNYELNCLISSTLKEEEIKKIIEKISSFIQEQEGLVTQSESPIEKTTAYPIENQRETFLITVDFSLKPDRVETINEKLKNTQEILRFFLSKKEKPRKKHQRRAPRKKTVLKEKPSLEKELSSSDEEKRRKDKLKEIDEKLDKILDN